MVRLDWTRSNAWQRQADFVSGRLRPRSNYWPTTQQQQFCVNEVKQPLAKFATG